MELRHLRYFVTVAEEMNVSRASARLRISQPAVSRQLRDLEEELGVDLFSRDKSRLKLTPAGEHFLVRARELLRRSTEAAGEMAAFRQLAKQKITVGYIAPVLASSLIPVLREFGQKHKNVEVVLREMDPGEQVKALRDHKLDIALPGNPCNELKDEFEVLVMRHIPLVAVLPDDHPLSGRERVSLSELKNEVFIGFDETRFPGRNDAICRACKQAGFMPRLQQRVESLSALLAKVAAGDGVTLTPEEVGQLPHPGAVLIALKRPVPSVASAAVFRKDEPRPLLIDFLTSKRNGRPGSD